MIPAFLTTGDDLHKKTLSVQKIYKMSVKEEKYHDTSTTDNG
jgi:hypothetical protein